MGLGTGWIFCVYEEMEFSSSFQGNGSALGGLLQSYYVIVCTESILHWGHIIKWYPM
jgi:hypothetical protein